VKIILSPAKKMNTDPDTLACAGLPQYLGQAEQLLGWLKERSYAELKMLWKCNDRIAQLADGENIFYLDINEVVTDETGNLNPDYTWDEVHLLGKYDMMWLEYFCSHAIIK